LFVSLLAPKLLYHMLVTLRYHLFTYLR